MSRHCARATHLRVIAPGQHSSFRRNVAVGNTVSHLTGPRFEPRTSRSRDERVTARPTWSYFFLTSIERIMWSGSGPN